jgi:hypothetical protein
MTQNEGRNTWRTDNRYSPCPRTQAGEYLAFLASIGHTLIPIEQAVTDGVPWTGDTPSDTLTESADDPVGDDGPDSGSSGSDKADCSDAEITGGAEHAVA